MRFLPVALIAITPVLYGTNKGHYHKNYHKSQFISLYAYGPSTDTMLPASFVSVSWVWWRWSRPQNTSKGSKAHPIF